jgi:prepilin-type N-terminal cleavage/methylation domain-containing protein
MNVKLPAVREMKLFEGYTLVEVIMGVAIMAVVLAALFGGLISGFAIINTSRQDLRATQILTQKTEAIRLCTWSQLASLPASFQEYYYPPGTTNGTAGILYYGKIAIGTPTMIPNTVSYQSNIDQVTISVVWTNFLEGHPVVHSRQIQTLVSLNGIQNYVYGYQ